MTEYYDGEQEDTKFGMAFGFVATMHAEEAKKARMQLQQVRAEVQATLDDEKKNLKAYLDADRADLVNIDNCEGWIEALIHVLKVIDNAMGEDE